MPTQLSAVQARTQFHSAREREREIVVCQSERQDQHECQTVAESIKTSPLSLYLWARSMAPYGIIPASPDPLSTSRHLLQLLLVRPQLICSRIIMVCPSQVPTLVEYIFFFVIDLFLHLVDSHLRREQGRAGVGSMTMLDARLQHCVSVKRQAEPRHTDTGQGTRL